MYGYGDVDVNGVPLCVLGISYALQYDINWQNSAFYDRSSTNFDRSSEKLLTFSAKKCILLCKKKRGLSSQKCISFRFLYRLSDFC